MKLPLPAPLLVVTLPLPSRELSANARNSRWKKSKPVQDARAVSKMRFKEEMTKPSVWSCVDWPHGKHRRSGIVTGLLGEWATVEFASGATCSIKASRLRVAFGPWPLDGATVLPVFYRPNGNALVRDEDNAQAMCKAYCDGAQDAGLVANDRHLRHLPAELRVDKADPRLEIWVYPGRLEYTGEGAP